MVKFEYKIENISKELLIISENGIIFIEKNNINYK